MSVSENDLELLESYLDDELRGAELEALRRRLSSEPALNVVMDELRGQRDMRQMFFSTCEPDQMSVERLVQSVKRQATREIVWADRNRKLRWAGSLAACLLVGFGVGRGTHKSADPTNLARQPQQQTVIVSGPRAPVSPQNPQNPQNPLQHLVGTDEVTFNGPRIVPTPDFNITRINPNNVAPKMAGYQVRLVDASGNVIRHFDSPEQFNKFVSEQTAPASQPSMRFPGN
jgi:hypothetical protein